MVRGAEAASCNARRALSALLLRRRVLSLSSIAPMALHLTERRSSLYVQVHALHTSWLAHQRSLSYDGVAGEASVSESKDELAREVARLEKEFNRVQAESALLSRELQHAAAEEAQQQQQSNAIAEKDGTDVFAHTAATVVGKAEGLHASESSDRAVAQGEDRGDDAENVAAANTTNTTAMKAKEQQEEKEEEAAEAEWPEPTLSDLDRSIPQVDCVFIANLVRSRNAQREHFLQQKAELQSRVDQLTQATMKTVFDQSKLRTVGGLPYAREFVQGRIQQLKAIATRAIDGEHNSLIATNAADVEENSLAPVQAAPAVLAQLSSAEQDMLYSLRPEYDDGFILLDCRTVNEVTSWGIIEGAKVLPAHELFDAFHATPADFLRDYGFAKPRPDQTIICYCQFGPRSLMAAQILSWMGYLKVLHFRDGYYEWGKQYNLLLRTWMEHDKSSGNELRRLAAFQAGLELQREIAPEFNALPMQEAAQYQIDVTRSPGTLRVGEGLRGEAYAQLAKLINEPIALPEGSGSNNTDSEAKPALGGGKAQLAADHIADKTLKQQQLLSLFAQATGLDMTEEMNRAQDKDRNEMSLAQAVAMTAVDSPSAIDRIKPR